MGISEGWNSFRCDALARGGHRGARLALLGNARGEKMTRHLKEHRWPLLRVLECAALVWLTVAIAPAAARAAGPAPGTMLGPDTAQQADGLLPTEFLSRYQ